MKWLQPIRSLFSDPPPRYAFEMSEAGIAMATIDPGENAEVQFVSLPSDVLSISPVKDNVLMPDTLASVVRQAVPGGGTRKRAGAALILPDFAVRISVVEFDSFPKEPSEQIPLVRFRIRKSLPFDAESAVVRFWPQPVKSEGKIYVITAAAPVDIIARYEAPFRAAGLQPGIVTVSSLAMLSLVEGPALTVIARLSGRILSLLIVDGATLRLVRCLELASDSFDDIAADLYPTFAYVEDQLGRRADRLLLAGFGGQSAEARQRLEHELSTPAEILRSSSGMVLGPYDAGLLGYLEGVAPSVAVGSTS